MLCPPAFREFGRCRVAIKDGQAPAVKPVNLWPLPSDDVKLAGKVCPGDARERPGQLPAATTVLDWSILLHSTCEWWCVRLRMRFARVVPLRSGMRGQAFIDEPNGLTKLIEDVKAAQL